MDILCQPHDLREPKKLRTMGLRQTADTAAAIMPQAYPRSQYQPSSTILPPLQRGRNYPQATNGTAARGYFDQSQGTAPILPSQPIPTNEADRYGTAPGATAFEPPGSSNGTPR